MQLVKKIFMGKEIKTYRYKLDESSRKFRCPKCNKKRFVRYVDRKTDDYLPIRYGRCDREVNCGYFLDPYDDGYANENSTDWRETTQQPSEPPPTNDPYPMIYFQQA